MVNRPPAAVSQARMAPLGETALTVEFGNSIDPSINATAISFSHIIQARGWDGLLDVVPTYRSVTIHVDPLRLSVRNLRKRLRRLIRELPAHPIISGKEHIIPVVYGGEWGPDADDVARFAHLSPAEVIRLHSSVTYRVYMLGFSPGFPYLGNVPDPIAMPRLATPRVRVPAGSIGIAGNQTGIYPVVTPGGWRLIGCTPVALYRPMDLRAFLFSPGDVVRFEPISVDEFHRYKRDHDAGTPRHQ